MQFYTKSRRKPTVPIISLIDILAILLIFFILTTTFKEQKALLKIKLAESTQGQVSPSKARRIVLGISKEKKIFLDGIEVPIDNLSESLALLLSQQSDLKLQMKADEEIPFGFLVKVWDELAEAGLKDIPAEMLQKQAP